MHLLKNRTGLSVVVTTLIILVVSVLLATIVTFYAVNVVTTRVQESLHLTKQHVWYSASQGWAVAALVILNTGGRDVVIDKISVRGSRISMVKSILLEDKHRYGFSGLKCNHG
jgi:glucan phosphoethanolaminetransferase (alkaline phosphatase superfamily)